MESVIVLPCAATGDSAAGTSASTTRSATAAPAKLREILMDRPSSASGASRMARRYATLPELSSRRGPARGAGIRALPARGDAALRAGGGGGRGRGGGRDAGGRRPLPGPARAARDPDPHRARPAVRPRVVRHGGQRRAPPRRRPDARDRPVEPILPRRGIDRPPGAPNDGHALEVAGGPRRFERRLGGDLEGREARLAMIGLIDAVAERASIRRTAS